MQHVAEYKDERGRDICSYTSASHIFQYYHFIMLSLLPLEKCFLVEEGFCGLSFYS